MSTDSEIPRERLVRSTAEDAKVWEESTQGRAAMARIEAMGEQDIDFSDIPELPGLVERVTNVLRQADDDQVLAVMANAANLLRQRRAADRKAG